MYIQYPHNSAQTATHCFWRLADGLYRCMKRNSRAKMFTAADDGFGNLIRIA